jgi:hypothetical protein
MPISFACISLYPVLCPCVCVWLRFSFLLFLITFWYLIWCPS